MGHIVYFHGCSLANKGAQQSQKRAFRWSDAESAERQERGTMGDVLLCLLQARHMTRHATRYDFAAVAQRFRISSSA
jgi:hypothetical protein